MHCVKILLSFIRILKGTAGLLVRCFMHLNYKETKMNEVHLIVGSVVACLVLVVSAINLYEVTHSK